MCAQPGSNVQYQEVIMPVVKQKTLGVHGPLTDQQVPKPYSEVGQMNKRKEPSYRWEVEISARKQDEPVWSTSRV